MHQPSVIILLLGRLKDDIVTDREDYSDISFRYGIAFFQYLTPMLDVDTNMFMWDDYIFLSLLYMIDQ